MKHKLPCQTVTGEKSTNFRKLIFLRGTRIPREQGQSLLTHFPGTELSFSFPVQSLKATRVHRPHLSVKGSEVLVTDAQSLEMAQGTAVPKRGKSVKNQEEMARQPQCSVKVVGQHGVCSLPHRLYKTKGRQAGDGQPLFQLLLQGGEELGFRDAKLNRKSRDRQLWPEVLRPTASAPNPGC